MSAMGAVAASGPDATEMKRLNLLSLVEEDGDPGSRVNTIHVSSVTEKTIKVQFTDKDIMHEALGEEELSRNGPEAASARTEWLRRLGMGFCCMKGLKPEAKNQDSFSILYRQGEFSLYGVYDGHGPCGEHVSEMARDILPKLFLLNLKKCKEDESEEPVHEAFEESFTEIQNMIQKESKKSSPDASSSGTTCTMVYHDHALRTITVAHVGDSRCVIARRERPEAPWTAEDLTEDHKPNNPKERARIENSDPPGRVIFDGFYNYRVFSMTRMAPGLNMSRALGDVIAHMEAGLSAVPDIKTIRLESDSTEVMIALCTDGVWEFIDAAEYAKFLNSVASAPVQEQALKLATEAYKRWMEDSDEEISDDITAILFRINV